MIITYWLVELIDLAFIAGSLWKMRMMLETFRAARTANGLGLPAVAEFRTAV